MKNLFVSMLLFLSTTGGYVHRLSDVRAPVVSDGAYIGLEKMPSLTPEDPATAWFHENTLVIRNGEAILDKVPITMRHGSKTYQAADGGFLTYRARFIVKDGVNVVQLRLIDSMYIIFRRDQHDQYSQIETYPVTFTAGSIEFEGVRYRPTVLKKVALDRLVHLLNTEPLDKANAER
jgi:hypothetical protein